LYVVEYVSDKTLKNNVQALVKQGQIIASLVARKPTLPEARTDTNNIAALETAAGDVLLWWIGTVRTVHLVSPTEISNASAIEDGGGFSKPDCDKLAEVPPLHWAWQGSSPGWHEIRQDTEA
jgi:hypothetical protein